MLRLPVRAPSSQLLEAVETLAAGLAGNELYGRLWIVEPGRLRVYQPKGDDV